MGLEQFVIEGPARKDAVQTTYQWTLGRKHLLLHVRSDHTADTLVENIRGQKIPGATTCLYGTARKRMEDLAARDGSEIKYEFATRNGQVIKWSRDESKGGRVFHWTEERNPHWFWIFIGLGFYFATETISAKKGFD